MMACAVIPWTESNPYMELQHPGMAGLVKAMLYMRPDAVDLWNYLDEKNVGKYFIPVTGQPNKGSMSIDMSKQMMNSGLVTISNR